MGKKILLIDESAMLRRIAASVLGAQPARYEVLAATRATEGFARACSSGVDLILADQRLSDVQGNELTWRLLSEPRTSRVPVVLLIGRGTPLPPLETLQENVVEVLGKPFAPEQLVATVNAIIDLIQSRAGFSEIRGRLHAPPRTPPAEAPFRAAVQEVAPSWAIKPAFPPAIPEAAPVGFSVENSLRRPYLQRNSAAVSPRATLLEIARERLNGVLRFHPPGGRPLEVFFENGRVVVVTTRDGLAYSEGALAMLSSKVSPATLEATVQEQVRDGIPFLLTLGARGLLSKAAAEALLHQFGQRCYARLWTLKPGVLTYEFEKMDALPGFALRLAPRQEGVDEWFLGTLRHLVIGDLADLARHEGFVGTPSFRPGGEAILQPLSLTAAERDFAGHVNGHSDLPTLGKVLGLSPESAFLALYRFRGLEAMDYRPAPAAFAVTPRTSRRRVLPLPR